ncbi:MAG: Gfo/Idh/MocA family oxidoreductase [Candidatus Omnitrophota bacterium]
MTRKKLRVLICGLGSIGTRHARILKENFSFELGALRFSGKGNDLGLREFYSWGEAAQFVPDIVFVTNATGAHIPAAWRAAQLGAAIFLEKPVSDSMQGVARLEQLCRKQQVCYVAYPLRFLPVVQQAKKFLEGKKILYGRAVCASYLPDWRPGRDPRQCYSAVCALGGGVILDLSHEFDTMTYLMGPVVDIHGIKGRALDITLDAEDFADALMTFKNGVYASVHIDFMSRKVERAFHIDFDGGYVDGDLIGNTLKLVDGRKTRVLALPSERDEYLLAQTRYFLKNLRNPALMNNLSEAKILFQQIIRFRNS